MRACTVLHCSKQQRWIQLKMLFSLTFWAQNKSESPDLCEHCPHGFVCGDALSQQC